jgi:hypothetical protein
MTFSGGTSVSGRSRVALAVATGCATWIAVAGCVSQDPADTVNRRLHNGMSTSEMRIAYGAALRQARNEDARVTARATVSEGEDSASSNSPPRPCTSGRLLHITLAGQFPHALHPGDSGSPAERGQELTVDATTGLVCDAHYVTGLIMSDPTSVVLFTT